MSRMEVRELKSGEADLWDELVEGSPQGTVFHRSSWLSACSETLNKELAIYGCFRDDRLLGGCSLFRYRLKRAFKVASSPPRMTPYGGIVVAPSSSTKVRDKEEEYSGLAESLCDFLNSEHLDLIRMVNSPALVDIRPFIRAGWGSRVYYSYYLNLEGDLDKRVSKEVRSAVRKATKGGIEVERPNDSSIFYDLFSMTFERQGLKPPASREFFDRMIGFLRSSNLGDMWIARTTSGDVASAEIFAWDDKRAYRWAAASHTDFRQTGSVSFLLYEVLQDMMARGFREVDLMAASTKQLARFISSFNPELVPLYSLEKKRILFRIAEGLYRMIVQR